MSMDKKLDQSFLHRLRTAFLLSPFSVEPAFFYVLAENCGTVIPVNSPLPSASVPAIQIPLKILPPVPLSRIPTALYLNSRRRNMSFGRFERNIVKTQWKGSDEKHLVSYFLNPLFLLITSTR